MGAVGWGCRAGSVTLGRVRRCRNKRVLWSAVEGNTSDIMVGSIRTSDRLFTEYSLCELNGGVNSLLASVPGIKELELKDQEEQERL